MTLKVGETGKIIRVNAAYDMSSNTEITLTFTKPGGTEVTKTLGAGELSLGAGVTDADLGALTANEYVEYDIESGFLDTAGTWSVYITYTNTGATPDDNFIGDEVTFTVSNV